MGGGKDRGGACVGVGGRDRREEVGAGSPHTAGGHTQAPHHDGEKLLREAELEAAVDDLEAGLAEAALVGVGCPRDTVVLVVVPHALRPVLGISQHVLFDDDDARAVQHRALAGAGARAHRLLRRRRQGRPQACLGSLQKRNEVLVGQMLQAPLPPHDIVLDRLVLRGPGRSRAAMFIVIIHRHRRRARGDPCSVRLRPGRRRRVWARRVKGLQGAQVKMDGFARLQRRLGRRGGDRRPLRRLLLGLVEELPARARARARTRGDKENGSRG